MRSRFFRFALLFALIFTAKSAFAAGGSCGSIPVPSGVTTCFFVSKSAGNDANSGTSEQSPWAHLPGMPSCTGACASATPAPGEGFILRGGDTWTASDLGVYWKWAGTANAPVYIGVDPKWYAGSSWTRPIWNCGGVSCSFTSDGDGYYVDWSGVQYVTVDNIEVTGLYFSSGNYPNYFSIYGSNNTFQNIYAHGWSHAAWTGSGPYDNSAVFSPSTCCGGGQNNVFHDNVIDGSDTAKDSMAAFFGAPAVVYNNIVKYVTNGLEGSANSIHDNWFGPIVYCLTGSCHQNAIQQASTVSGSNAFVYNNVITQVSSGGMPKIWVEQSSVNNGSLKTYVFNNVLFNNANGNDVDICQLGTNCGTHYVFNNTFQCGNDSSVGTCSTVGSSGGPTTVINWMNNHCIASACISVNSGANNITLTQDTNLVQSVSQAKAQGYTDSGSYAFMPTNGSGGTSQGTNLQSLCATIGGVDSAAGIACQNDTGYACVYNTSNHAVSCPSRTTDSRQAAWNIGAYQYSGQQAQTVQAPTGLTATVQ